MKIYPHFIKPFISSVVGWNAACRFTPSCSLYARQAMHRWGPVRGSWLSLRRFFKCHPLHSGGYDPVPKR